VVDTTRPRRQGKFGTFSPNCQISVKSGRTAGNGSHLHVRVADGADVVVAPQLVFAGVAQAFDPHHRRLKKMQKNLKIKSDQLVIFH
jgi:hypothetical protein